MKKDYHIGRTGMRFEDMLYLKQMHLEDLIKYHQSLGNMNIINKTKSKDK